VILGLSLWLSEFSVAHSDPAPQSDNDDDDGSDEANKIAELVQGPDAEVPSGPSQQAPASTPSSVNMVSSLDRFGSKEGAEKPGWDAIKMVRANMCVDMLKKHGEDFDKKEKCIAFMDDSCGTSKITKPTGKGTCTEWYKLLAVAQAGKASPPAPAANATNATKEDAASSAHAAAESAKDAAKVANKIATHSIKLADNAKASLEKARDAVHKARVDGAGLSDSQKHSLKAAEAKLREATKKAEYGQVKNAKYVKAKAANEKLQKMEKKLAKLEKPKKNDELEAMRREIEQLRKELKKKEGDKAEDDALLKELQDQIKEMEEAEKKEDKQDKKSHDELKAEIERLRQQIKDMQDAKEEEPPKPAEPPKKAQEEDVEKYNVKMKPLEKSDEVEEEPQQESGEATPVEQKGIDIDTAMPYGDLEPFGREDTAQELTESSIKESDEMVDQLERAEVAEEKRAVFRALTRLRGAAITSFDGVARSQTGNIDEYNKIHKWRNTHPLHHLADEESDVSKWAFPDNAD